MLPFAPTLDLTPKGKLNQVVEGGTGTMRMAYGALPMV